MKNREFSLLYPEGYAKERQEYTCALPPRTVIDLEIENLIEFITPQKILKNPAYESIKNIFLYPCKDEEIIQYRQDITSDLLEHQEIRTALERLLPVIGNLHYYRSGRFQQQSPLYALVYRIRELENYLVCIDTLKQAFISAGITEHQSQPLSAGLTILYDEVMRVYADETFTHMKENLPLLAKKIRNIRSINIGINLDDDLNPLQATLLSINSTPYTSKSPGVFNTLFHQNVDDLGGITPLHSRYATDRGNSFFSQNNNVSKKRKGMIPLFHDLSEVLKKVCSQIMKALNKYITINSELFINIQSELIFYIHSVRFLLTLQQHGLPVCKPEIRSREERITMISENYNPNFFIKLIKKQEDSNLRNVIVTNQVKLDNEGRIIILTGPNQGGKTVYTQGIGISQLLFQTGLYVPGKSAVMSVVDNIFTHFQIEEKMTRELGRFGDEAKRLNTALLSATPYSLLLMNESFTSTSYSESLHIARDVMRILCLLGIRAVFATHFHDLALEIDQINKETRGKSKLISMVSMIRENKNKKPSIQRTFKIVPSAPMSKSYAREIAQRYDLSFHQLHTLLQKRGFIKN